jgi:hypothetical protein
VFHGDYRDHYKHHRTKWKKEYYDGVYIHPKGVLYYSAVRALPQVVSDRRLTAEARVRFQANVCGICTWRSVIEKGFYPSCSAYPFSIASQRLHTAVSFICHQRCIILEIKTSLNYKIKYFIILLVLILICYKCKYLMFSYTKY